MNIEKVYISPVLKMIRLQLGISKDEYCKIADLLTLVGNSNEAFDFVAAFNRYADQELNKSSD